MCNIICFNEEMLIPIFLDNGHHISEEYDNRRKRNYYGQFLFKTGSIDQLPIKYSTTDRYSPASEC
ncbi:hypothetical protein D3C73_1419590 [compost metagenome]